MLDRVRRPRAVRAWRRDRRRRTSTRLRCAVVCGAANNQLADDALADALREPRDPLRARLHRQRRRADPRLRASCTAISEAQALELVDGIEETIAGCSRIAAGWTSRRWRGRASWPERRARPRRPRCETEARCAELWVVRCGLVPYEEASPGAGKAREARAARRGARRAAAARAPARLHARAPLESRTSCRWARTGTGCRGSRSATPTAAAGSPTTARPAGRLPDRRLAEAVRRRRPRVRAAAGAGDDRLRSREYGIEAGPIEGLTGVWVGGAAAGRRRAQDRLDRHPRQPRRHHPRLRGQRHQRPAAVRVDRALRHRGLPDDLGHAASSAPSRTWTSSPPRSPSASRRSTSARPVDVRRRAGGAGRRARRPARPARRRRRRYGRAMGGRRAHPRHPLPRQPGRRDRDRGAAVPRAQAALAEGPGARRADLPPAEAGDRERQPAHGLRGGELPQRRRVLGARHRHVHDPRRRLHPPLRLLQRADRACRPGTTRSSRCASPTR